MKSEATGKRAARPTAHAGQAARRIAGGQIQWPLGDLETLKNQLLAELLAGEMDAELALRLRRAADESASLAWTTAYPLLTLPELLAEKGREARRQFERQQLIQSRGRNVVSLAA